MAVGVGNFFYGILAGVFRISQQLQIVAKKQKIVGYFYAYNYEFQVENLRL
jgi:hypothetical protein